MVLLAAIDQGTSSSRFLVFDASNAELIVNHQLEVRQQFPQPGQVEMCPLEIYDTVVRCMEAACKELTEKGYHPSRIRAIGLTNQRETTVVWDKETGEPLHNAIVWLDNRTDELAKEYIQRTPNRSKEQFKGKTGLPIHPYFCALKIRWLLDNVPAVREALERDTLMVGTVDTWLLWKLIGVYATDVTNASRTLLMDLRQRRWSTEMCQFFDIPLRILPEIRSSAELYGYLKQEEGPLAALKGIPLSGCLGDQQSALLGHGCVRAGQAKNTYGTGTFMLCNTGKEALFSSNGLLTTISYQFGKGADVCYALEGSGSIGGNVVRFLRDNLGFIEKSSDVEEMAKSVASTEDVYFVPCFTGLYTPQWDPSARGLICGLTQSATKAHIALAALKAVAFQSVQMVQAVEHDMGERKTTILKLKADGGMTQNTLFNQIQADLLGRPLECSKMTEISGWGAAFAAGIGMGLIDVKEDETLAEEVRQRSPRRIVFYSPQMDAEQREKENAQWNEAIKRARGWATHGN